MATLTRTEQAVKEMRDTGLTVAKLDEVMGDSIAKLTVDIAEALRLKELTNAVGKVTKYHIAQLDSYRWGRIRPTADNCGFFIPKGVVSDGTADKPATKKPLSAQK